jgi:hypothetical protein
MSLLVHKNRANHPEVIQPKPMGAILRMGETAERTFQESAACQPLLSHGEPYTVSSGFTDTLLLWTPRYYGHLDITDRKSHLNTLKKTRK